MTKINHVKNVLKSILKDSLQFIAIVVFVALFSGVFGTENSLAGVSLVIGVMMFPLCYTGVTRKHMCVQIIAMYTLLPILAALSTYNIYLGLVINFLTISWIMITSSEPNIMIPHFTYVLTYSFCLLSNVTGKAFILREISMIAGGIIIAAVTCICWRRKKLGDNGRSFRSHISLCIKNNKQLIFRLTIGYCVSIFICNLLGLPRAAWAAIPVLSVTQTDYKNTSRRMGIRLLSTIAGASVFALLFGYVLPEQYYSFVPLILGYMGCFSFMKKYGIQQFFNAINAMYAALVIFNIGEDITNRIICLLIGLAVVAAMMLVDKLMFSRKEEQTVEMLT